MVKTDKYYFSDIELIIQDAIEANSSTWAFISLAPNAQFKPILKGLACCNEI